MIVFRRKEYSDLLTQVAYKVNLAKAKVMSPIKHKRELVNKYRIQHDSTAYSPYVDAMKDKTKAPSVSKYQVARETIANRKKLDHNIKYTTHRASTDPGNLVSDTIQHTLENPIAVGGTVTGYRYLIPGTTAASVATEAFAKKKIPGYRRVTETLGKTYNKSLGKVVGPVVNAINETAKTL